MDYLEDEAKKGFVAITVIALVILFLGLILSSMIDFTADDYYGSAVATAPK
ncbi:hypothetical protein [Pedobacter sp. SYSU D00535]|uniref:hypothetical protein n=1 Tax=Pedobacter sp. SYSU D00535 TaxID=2810308 RepID=UPI001A96B478|nr:hypothetical protein [Pedobacter sp. SYSU D00535]